MTAGGGELDTLNIFIEGDGRPYLSGWQPRADPTSPTSPVLALLRDDQANLWLGRPCYHGLASQSRCGPALWTTGRYSQGVVASMVSAARNVIHASGARRVRLIGFSGGGTLAWLMARELHPATVVTLAGNLNVEQWIIHHGYAPLDGSLDPSKLPRLRPDIRQFHFVGVDDRVIPSALTKAFAHRESAFFRALPNVDHACCWLEVFPRVLAIVRGKGG